MGKRTATNRTILSKRNAAFTTGYDLSINAGGYAEMSWMNGTKQTITSSVVIPADKWHNIAVSYDGSNARMYIDGILDVTTPLSAILTNTQSFLIAAADGTSTTSFFTGTIDEVRVWGAALTVDQLRYVMNQELVKHTDNSVNGKIVPQTVTLNEVKSIPWSTLKAYYPMSTYTYTNAKDKSDNDYTAALKNLITVNYQTAPVPYKTNADGPWYTPATWKNNDVQDLPYALSIVDGTSRVAWNIVQINHNVQSTGNKVVLSMELAANKELTADNDTKIEISHYLDLNGKIDLEGKSQLVQTLGSDLDPTSAGSIERDQQGTKNIYNYNYWSSPVSSISATSNNLGFTVSDVFKDGTDSDNIKDINWIDGYDSAPGDPISLAQYWIFKFQNVGNDYANWSQMGASGTLLPGEAFTLKGSGTANDTQNYTFVGKPNNAQITLPIGGGFLNLTGNPYPSALDANKFLLDNASSLDGTIYFWEHYSTNASHNLADYQGGYAAYNLTGGTPPVSPANISGLGSSTRTPKRYIPVGQGFFVTGSTSGGTIKFDNSQRGFFKENNTSSYGMFRNASPTTDADATGNSNNEDDQEISSNFMKVRLGFNSVNNWHRQILIGFMNNLATSAIDPGFDAVLFDDFPSDMYFINGETPLVIQGEGYFNAENSYKLGVKSAEDGNIQFVLDDIQNFDDNQQVYIYDAETDSLPQHQRQYFRNQCAGRIIYGTFLIEIQCRYAWHRQYTCQ
ncbi:LamG domain-containing protein [Flavobacterium sp. 3HN19-14]|uniref:LamG domain-containing protein n=1 Tax=Flavobacterium sp. 3HN19-14 TaxID=3448133 RepID=UPI003EE286EF